MFETSIFNSLPAPDISYRLEAHDVSFQYGSQTVIQSIHLKIPPGCILGLIGPNGSGKTTLLRCMAGLLPAQGQIFYDGRPLSSLSKRARAYKRTYMSQAFCEVGRLCAYEVVALGWAHRHWLYHTPSLGRQRLWGAPSFNASSGSASSGVLNNIEQAVGHVLDEVGFTASRSQPLDTLSGGEQQQVGVARALLASAPLILLDEPTRALDLCHQMAVMTALKSRACKGAAVVISLHDLNLASVVCDRLLLLHQGQGAAWGSPDQVLTPSILKKVYHVDVVSMPHPCRDVPLLAWDLPLERTCL